MAPPEITPRFEFIAGSPALNFLNTVWERVGYRTSQPSPPHELLNTLGDLISWAKGAAVISEQEGRILSRIDQSEEGKILQRFQRSREIIFALFRDRERKDKGLSDSIESVNSLLQKLPPQRLTFKAGVFSLQEPGDFSFDSLLHRIYRDTARVLCTADLSRIRFCDADDCGWIFLDTSKNGRRRWCDMSDCGNRDKVKRFLSRQRDSSPSL